MSTESDIFLIGVNGPKGSVIKMLNAAICNVGNGNVIEPDDDIKAINLKLEGFSGRDGHDIGIFDLFDRKCMEDEAILKKKENFYAKRNACLNCPFDCPNSKRNPGIPPLGFESQEEEYQKMSEFCPWPEPFYAEDASPEPNRYIEIVRVEESGKDLTAKFSWYMFECYGPDDWGTWEDIARLYGCSVFIDDNYFRNGAFIRFESATVIEPGGKDTIRLESGKTEQEYDAFMDKLAELYPERYSPVRDRYLQEKAARREDALNRVENEIAGIKVDDPVQEKHQPEDDGKWIDEVLNGDENYYRPRPNC